MQFRVQRIDATTLDLNFEIYLMPRSIPNAIREHPLRTSAVIAGILLLVAVVFITADPRRTPSPARQHYSDHDLEQNLSLPSVFVTEGTVRYETHHSSPTRTVSRSEAFVLYRFLDGSLVHVRYPLKSSVADVEIIGEGESDEDIRRIADEGSYHLRREGEGPAIITQLGRPTPSLEQAVSHHLAILFLGTMLDAGIPGVGSRANVQLASSPRNAGAQNEPSIEVTTASDESAYLRLSFEANAGDLIDGIRLGDGSSSHFLGKVVACRSTSEWSNPKPLAGHRTLPGRIEATLEYRFADGSTSSSHTTVDFQWNRLPLGKSADWLQQHKQRRGDIVVGSSLSSPPPRVVDPKGIAVPIVPSGRDESISLAVASAQDLVSSSQEISTRPRPHRTALATLAVSLAAIGYLTSASLKKHHS